jgi:hypothetical protein
LGGTIAYSNQQFHGSVHACASETFEREKKKEDRITRRKIARLRSFLLFFITGRGSACWSGAVVRCTTSKLGKLSGRSRLVFAALGQYLI